MLEHELFPVVFMLIVVCFLSFSLSDVASCSGFSAANVWNASVRHSLYTWLAQAAIRHFLTVDAVEVGKVRRTGCPPRRLRRFELAVRRIYL